MPLRGALLKLFRKPSPKKVEKLIKSLNDEVWKLKSQGKDVDEIRSLLSLAQQSFNNNDPDAADFYVYEAQKLIKKAKK